MADELVILTVSDSTYLPFARVLFNSIKSNVTIPYKFHLHAINVPDENLIFFKENFKNIKITMDNIELDEAPDKTNQFSKSKKASYCANIRVKIIHDLMVEGFKYILYLDADSIVLKDLDKLFRMIQSQNTEILIRTRDDGTRIHSKVLTGVIGINNNFNTLKFIELWKSLILDENSLYKWYADQVMFTENMEKNIINITTLPWEYIDTHGFSLNSFIWSGKGNRKYNNVKYTKEMEKYK